MEYKRYLAFTIVLSVLMFSLGFALNPILTVSHQVPTARANVYVMVETPEGREIFVGNTIADICERDVRNILGFRNGSAVAYKYIALGNSSIAQTKTKLDTEATTTGFARDLGTVTAWQSGADYAFNVTKKFTATGTIAVNSASLHWNATGNSDNNLCALASLGGTQSFSNLWNATITWVIVCNFN